MSGATYRIDVEHRPSDTDTPYYAIICRLSDGYYVDVKSGRTAEEALQRARATVAALNAQEATRSYFVADDGMLAPEQNAEFWSPRDPTLQLLREYSVKAHG